MKAKKSQKAAKRAFAGAASIAPLRCGWHRAACPCHGPCLSFTTTSDASYSQQAPNPEGHAAQVAPLVEQAGAQVVKQL